MIAVTANSLYTPLTRLDRPLVLIDDASVVAVCSQSERAIPTGAESIDFGDAILAPGFVDIHIHGSAGYDVMQSDPASLPAVERFLAQRGVSSYLPTTVTSSFEETLSALERLAGAVRAAENDQYAGSDRARPRGIHLEGPFISHKRRGVHPSELLLPPSLKTFERFWQAAEGRIRVLTIAPELEGAVELISQANERDICVSLGHSDADLAETRAGVAAGARHATHVFNAMRPLTHRDPGIIGEILTNPRLSGDIIADGIHIDPAIVKLVAEAKGPENLVLITDAISATGMPDGHYRLGSFEVEVKDGRCLFEDTLAGSVLTMDVAVRNLMRFADCSIEQALRAATLNPARTAGLNLSGRLEAGSAADLVVLGAQGELRATILGGRVLSAANHRGASYD